MMKAAATFLTRGHLMSATMVSRFPRIPTTMIKTVMVAAKSSNGLENLKQRKINNYCTLIGARKSRLWATCGLWSSGRQCHVSTFRRKLSLPSSSYSRDEGSMLLRINLRYHTVFSTSTCKYIYYLGRNHLDDVSEVFTPSIIKVPWILFLCDQTT